MSRYGIVEHVLRPAALAAMIMSLTAAGCGAGVDRGSAGERPTTSVGIAQSGTGGGMQGDARHYVGLTVSEAEGRARENGLVVRIVDVSQPISAERQFNRVNFKVEDGRVADAWSG